MLVGENKVHDAVGHIGLICKHGAVGLLGLINHDSGGHTGRMMLLDIMCFGSI